MADHSATWLDGLPVSELPLPDRAVDFGDGLFETVLLQNGRPLYPDMHFSRLALGMSALAIPDCTLMAKENLAVACQSVMKMNWHWAALRLTVSRGPGPRGYAPPLHPVPRVLISVVNIQRDCAAMADALTANISRIKLAHQPALARIKHLNRLEQVLAATHARADGADEAIMLDLSGRLVSLIAANLFVVCNGVLKTPEIVGCGIAGTRRQLTIEQWAPAVGINVEECRLTPADLESADEVFSSNSLYGLRPIAKIGERSWSKHPVCEALFDHYHRALR